MTHIMTHIMTQTVPARTPRLIFYQKRIPEEVEVEVDLLQTCCEACLRAGNDTDNEAEAGSCCCWRAPPPTADILSIN